MAVSIFGSWLLVLLQGAAHNYVVLFGVYSGIIAERPEAFFFARRMGWPETPQTFLPSDAIRCVFFFLLYVELE